jgi:Aspartyl/Asparaginyl beta-hydroxylase
MTSVMTYFQKCEGPPDAGAITSLRSELHDELGLDAGPDLRTVVFDAAETAAVRCPVAIRILDDIATSRGSELAHAEYLIIPASRAFACPCDGHRQGGRRDRYHLVVCGPAGSVARCEDEAVLMPEGSMWWVSGYGRHEIRNTSARWQAHLVFDLLPPPILLM